MTNPTLNACLRKRRIYLNRITITLLGNPSHLGFWYSSKEDLLYVSAVGKDDLDAFEIPGYFWSTDISCEVVRMAFLKALQYRLGWEEDSKYSYAGTLTEREGLSVVAFNMAEGTKLR
jgi:hypothetical protein